nr:MAG TPA: hypothetical protein [Caudoviricetes sp.]
MFGISEQLETASISSGAVFSAATPPTLIIHNMDRLYINRVAIWQPKTL